MADYFKFTASDGFITGAFGLTGPEILAVTRWQNTQLAYDFSFHTMHTAGHPIYMCKEGDHGQRSMTKIDLKGKTAGQLAMVNAGKIDADMQADAAEVVGANLAAFQRMAATYYTGANTATPSAPAQTSVKCSKCKSEIGYVAVGAHGKRVCPKCKTWN